MAYRSRALWASGQRRRRLDRARRGGRESPRASLKFGESGKTAFWHGYDACNERF